MAKLAAVATTNVGKLERGEYVSSTTVKAVARALDLPTEMVAPFLDEPAATPAPSVDPATATLADLQGEFTHFMSLLSPSDMERLYRLCELYHQLQVRIVGHERA